MTGTISLSCIVLGMLSQYKGRDGRGRFCRKTGTHRSDVRMGAGHGSNASGPGNLCVYTKFLPGCVAVLRTAEGEEG